MKSNMTQTLKLTGCGALLALVLPFAVSADTISNLTITKDGVFNGQGLTVFQKAGTTFFTRATWGQAFVRITILTNASTKVTKSHGEAATVADINEKDVLDVTGKLNFGGDVITINASEIRDDELQTASKELSGTIKSVSGTGDSFVITDKNYGVTTVRLAQGGQITKGARTIFIPDLSAGDKVLSAEGTYDYTSQTLTASYVNVYQDKSIFTSRNFQGTLKSISGTDLPTTVVVTVGGTDYTVYLDKNAEVMKKNRSSALLSRFVVGDTVRFYGAIRQTNFSEVDAEVIRDLNF